jgi:hypothetical protein
VTSPWLCRTGRGPERCLPVYLSPRKAGAAAGRSPSTQGPLKGTSEILPQKKGKPGGGVGWERSFLRPPRPGWVVGPVQLPAVPFLPPHFAEAPLSWRTGQHSVPGVCALCSRKCTTALLKGELGSERGNCEEVKFPFCRDVGQSPGEGAGHWLGAALDVLLCPLPSASTDS